ncbi:class I SAM-dependent methyltransferase [Nonomuraea pusilla]|uniref:Methyltransferase domain-containing protein n=1 Tax=Nonomuraea pusilla TaxID=46177 RepID=A0A1H8AGH2_9ACTN|nr:class I SAM-dependent methyltransferase [Nonomuraea pusilla]SEM69643.1 Methyltransferase domain-containing protein [Nonomuraea pusilla]
MSDHRNHEWNHNVHYHPLVLRALPERCESALDVGCGDGLLAAKLAARAGHVTGVDSSPEMIELARRRHPGVEFVHGDFMSWPHGRYDVVTSVATIHHMAFDAALSRMAAALRPGGTLVVLGVPRTSPADLPYELLGVPYNRLMKALRREAQADGMPARQPEMTWAEVRRRARRLLPGVRCRRHLLWRYSLVWCRPPGR